MLTPLIKQEGTTRTERHLARIAEDAFFSLWSYPSVYRDEGIGQNGTGKEVADLIVIFDKDIIIFSDKDIAYKQHRDPKVAWGRWYRAAIKESAKQLHGAESFIRNHPTRLFLDKTCKVRFPFEINPDELTIHLVAIARNSTTHARKYFDSVAAGSSESLVHSYYMNEKQALEHPFNVPDIDKNKTFIHVFDDFSLDLVLLHLETIADFVNYLHKKEFAVRKCNLGQVHGEEDFLAFYLENLNNLGFGAGLLPKKIPKDFHITIPESWWSSFFASERYGIFESIRKHARPWGRIIREFSESVSAAKVGEGMHLPFLTHENAIRALASENLISRSVLSQALLEKYAEVPRGARSARIIWSLNNPTRLFIFLLFPWSGEYANYSEYRENRSACMTLYGMVARYKYPESEEIVIFALDTQGAKGSSETIMTFHGGQGMSDDEKQEAQKIMEEQRILFDTKEKKFKGKFKSRT